MMLKVDDRASYGEHSALAKTYQTLLSQSSQTYNNGEIGSEADISEAQLLSFSLAFLLGSNWTYSYSSMV